VKIVRTYKKYQDYVDHQKHKTTDPKRRRVWLNDEWESKKEMFGSLFARFYDLLQKGGKAICLCARTGQEVEALNRMGFEAIAIDLVECLPLVVEGDIHDLKFDDNEFDFAFSNSFDHSLYPEKFLSEMQRVLKPNGYGLLHLQLMEKPDKYAENVILSADPVIEKLIDSEIIENRSLKGVPMATYHWEILFRKKS